MRYLKMLFQSLFNLFNPYVSIFSRIENSKISPKTKIYHGVKLDNVKVGNYTYICPNVKIGYAEIGKFCSIAENSYIGLPSHPINHISTSPIFISSKNATGFCWVKKNISFTERKKVYIGNDVWIGVNALIMGGITIENGAIIGAGAVVTKNVPAYAIVAGVPAKIIRYRFPKETIDKLNNLEWWNLPESTIKNNLNIFQSENFKNLNFIKN